MKKSLPRILIALLIFVSGAALIPFVGLPAQGYSWQQYANAYVPVELQVNYHTGQPGSFFTITGQGFTPNSTATIEVNGQNLGSVNTDSNGELIFVIDSSGAQEGYYFVTVTAGDSATVSFRLAADAPNRPKEDDVTVFALPANSALSILYYMPILAHNP